VHAARTRTEDVPSTTSRKDRRVISRVTTTPR
jgi:hypothetical protein